MVAAEPVKPDTYTRFLESFQPYGLKSESFYAAYGLAENTLAVSLGGRNIVSVNKRALALGKARMTTEVSEIDAATQIVSCGTPLLGIDVKIVDPERHVALKEGLIGEIWVAGSGKCLGYWKNPQLTLKQFRARLVDDSPYDDGYLRTGDMGFFHNGELFVCGRIKDMIILRGQNYYPQDIENVVERASGTDPGQLRRRVPDSRRQRAGTGNRGRGEKSEGASGCSQDCRRGPELSQR